MLFSKTVQKTEEWLNELSDKMGWDSTQMAYDGLRAVLHALRDRLTVEAAVKFGAQLPLLVRGFYYEGWMPSSTPIKVHSAQEFIQITKENLRLTNVKDENVEELVFHVFQLIKEHMGVEETDKLQKILPKSIARLFEETGARLWQ
jgi:uncharacterized protein (DUF2267 family)